MQYHHTEVLAIYRKYCPTRVRRTVQVHYIRTDTRIYHTCIYHSYVCTVLSTEYLYCIPNAYYDIRIATVLVEL